MIWVCDSNILVCHLHLLQENRVGTGTGKYKNTQLFRTTQGYASLIPVMGLIKEDTFSLSATSSSYAPSSSSETRSSSTLTPEAISKIC